jgi:ribosome-binding factor A
VAEQILRDVSELMRDELNEAFSGMVTFTHVNVSDDLRYATVYYSHLGEESERSQVATYFDNERRRIRANIGRGLHMRHIPEFTFKFDSSIEHGFRIEELLRQIKNDDREDI